MYIYKVLYSLDLKQAKPLWFKLSNIDSWSSKILSILTFFFDLFTPDFVFLKKWYPIIGRLLYSVSPGLFYLLNRKSEIGTLHLEFDTGYDSVIRSIVESEIKNAATSISVNNFRFQRTSLEKYFHNKIKERLEGKELQF